MNDWNDKDFNGKNLTSKNNEHEMRKYNSDFESAEWSRFGIVLWKIKRDLRGKRKKKNSNLKKFKFERKIKV